MNSTKISISAPASASLNHELNLSHKHDPDSRAQDSWLQDILSLPK